MDITKQAENDVKIEGILSEVDLREGEYDKNGRKMPYIAGTIKVRVQQDINGVNTLSEIPVRVFSNKYTNAGKENPSYLNMKKVADGVGFTSIAASSESSATCVRITGASLAENNFPSRNNPEEIITTSCINASFVNAVNRAEFCPEATFIGTLVVGSIVEEVDRNGDSTGRLVVQGLIPQYGGRIDMIKYIVASENAVSHIQSYWNQGDTVKVKGKINFSSTTEYFEEEMGFGDPIRTARTKSIHELIITSGSAGALDEEMSYDITDVQRGLSERKQRIEAIKEKAKNSPKKAEKTETKASNFDF